MVRIILYTTAIWALGACSAGSAPRESVQPYSAIVEAVLVSQPDVARQHRDFVAEFPQYERWFDNIVDHRLCVAGETAGHNGDFIRQDRRSATEAPSFEIYSRRWEQSPSRREIPAQLLPDHLRWSKAFSICPSGTIRIGNPVIRGNRATIYVENHSATGWAGEYELAKRDGEWSVIEKRIWWIA